MKKYQILQTLLTVGIISDSIWRFAELGMEEFRSSDILIRALEQAGFHLDLNKDLMENTGI